MDFNIKPIDVIYRKSKAWQNYTQQALFNILQIDVVNGLNLSEHHQSNGFQMLKLYERTLFPIRIVYTILYKRINSLSLQRVIMVISIKNQ